MVTTLLLAAVSAQNSAMYPIVYEAPKGQGTHVVLIARPNAPLRDLGSGHHPTVAIGGRYVAFCSGTADSSEELVLQTGDSSLVTTWASEGNTSFASPVFSPDGNWLTFVRMPRPQSRAATADGPSIWVVATRKDAKPTLVADSSGQNPHPAFLPGNKALVFNMGGNWMIYSLADGGISALDTKSWLRDLPKGLTITRVVPFTAEPGKYLFAVSPASGTGLNAVFSVDMKTGSVARLSPVGIAGSAPYWAADGRTVLYEGDAGGKRGLYSVRSDGKAPQLVTLLPGSD